MARKRTTQKRNHDMSVKDSALRDQVAIGALQALLGRGFSSDLCALAYRIADEMLRVRNRKLPPLDEPEDEDDDEEDELDEDEPEVTDARLNRLIDDYERKPRKET